MNLRGFSHRIFARPQAFALVLTLLVSMMFVTFLLAAFSRLKVETQVQGNVTLQKEAKQEALWALEEALQTLQRHAGHDQRISAEASSFAGGLKGSNDVVHPRWIGVWSTESGGALKRELPLVWLVSGHGDSKVTPHQELEREERVWLVRQAAGDIDDNSVAAALVPSQHESKRRGLEGRQAWWVGDEGMKLRVYTGVTTTNPEPLKKVVERVPIFFAAHTLSGMQGLVPWHPESGKALRTSQLGFLAGTGKQNATSLALKKLFHDVTTHSLSILSDSHRGGLKLDLSAAMLLSGHDFESWREGLRKDSPWMHRHGHSLRAYHWFHLRGSWEKGRRIFECQPYLKHATGSTDSEGLQAAQRWQEQAKLHADAEFDEPKLSPEWMGHTWEFLVDWSSKAQTFELKAQARFRVWNPYHVALRARGFVFKTRLPTLHATFLQRRKWKSGYAYQIGDEVWYREALYRCIKKPTTQTPQSSGYWTKLGKNWSVAQPCQLALQEPSEMLELHSSSLEIEAGQSLDFELKTGTTNQIKVAELGSQGGEALSLGPWKPVGEVDESLEWSVVLEPSRLPSADYQQQSPHRWKELYGLNLPSEVEASPIYVEQHLKWGEEMGFLTKRMQLPELSFEMLRVSGHERGMVFESLEGSGLNQDQRFYVGVLGYQMSALDEAPLIRGSKGEERVYRWVDPRLFTNVAQFSDDAMRSAKHVECIWLESTQGKKSYRIPALADASKTAKALYELPSTSVNSLGQWQHVNLRQDVEAPTYHFANAYQESQASADATFRLHEELWDRYFFSGLDTKGERLPFFQIRAQVPPPSSPRSQVEQASSVLYLKGGFNVNTTRVEAWKGFLNAALNLPVQHQTSADGFQTLTSGQVCFPRQSVSPFGSVRKLSDKQVSALAEALVKQIRARGPFRSVSDFVNRNLQDKSASETGILEAALIEAQLWSDLKSLQTDSRTQQPMVARWQGRDSPSASAPFASLPRDKVLGSEQLLLAGDLLQVIGPYLTARSDTFKVRAYGEIREKGSGKRLARAWCEALVQRFPEWAGDPQEPPQVDPSKLTDPMNQKYGRRFQILHLKWLAPDEV